MTARPILLDVLGTIVHDPFYEDVPRFLGLTLEELFEAKHPTSWREFEKGTLSEAGFQLFRDGREFDREGLKRCFADGFCFLEGMQELLGELQRRGHDLHLFSNYPVWYHLIEDRLRLSRYARWSFVSCDTGLRKPDPEAYRHAARTLDVKLADCLFVDDRARNCAAAAALGMDSVLFLDATQLHAALESRGLL